MPIGNLTSQIFANIYLNEFDRFVMHTLKPLGYVRYGDDFIMLCRDKWEAGVYRERLIALMLSELKLRINSKNDIIVPVRRGIRFLGVEIWNNGRRLKERMSKRWRKRFSAQNAASYRAMVWKHCGRRDKKYLLWRVAEII